MKYQYECEECKDITIVTKSMYASDKQEFCFNCNSTKPLKRLYNAGAIKTSDGFKKSN